MSEKLHHVSENGLQFKFFAILMITFRNNHTFEKNKHGGLKIQFRYIWQVKGQGKGLNKW